jgi:hypothetical protein
VTRNQRTAAVIGALVAVLAGGTVAVLAGTGVIG